ncbi:MAG TPA: single-stranded DNA-binding protein [Galbitalea sp.]|jgi:single-stranded DNA-binding protein|nr:single-stranded DNA-binding protein [Galbitalea sp.]
MAIRTKQSLSGFIVTDPELTITSKGEARFYAKIGQEHFRRNDDGSFTQLESTFHNLVQYRKAAERSYQLFQKGDHFVAEGYVHDYDHDIDGQTQHAEEFVANRLGHDAARQNYTVDRKAVTKTLDSNPGLETNVAVDTGMATTGTPVSARSVAVARSARRRDQLVGIVPDGAGEGGPRRSAGLAL